MIDRERCPGCEGPNDCAIERGESTCWCFTAEVSRAAIDRLPEAVRGVACLCRACAAADGTPAEAAVPVASVVRSRR